MKPYISISSTSALAETGRYVFYYGDQAIDGRTQEWQFIVRKGDKVVYTLTNSQLMDMVDVDSQSPETMLLTGMLAYFGK
jgi:hypothetical protein